MAPRQRGEVLPLTTMLPRSALDRGEQAEQRSICRRPKWPVMKTSSPAVISS